MTRPPLHMPGTKPARLALLAVLIPVLAFALPVHAQQAGLGTSGNIVIEEGGAIWIEGSASVVDYTCRAQQISGTGTIKNTARPQDSADGKGGVEITISFPVRSLHCGKRAMNRDMYEALKAEEYPLIRYRLLEAGVADTLAPGEAAPPPGETGTWRSIRTRGVLTIAGVSDTTEVVVRGRVLDDNRFRVKGSRELNMDTFNITPPSALMGLIRADKQLTVHFDVTVRFQEEDS